MSSWARARKIVQDNYKHWFRGPQAPDQNITNSMLEIDLRRNGHPVYNNRSKTVPQRCNTRTIEFLLQNTKYKKRKLGTAKKDLALNQNLGFWPILVIDRKSVYCPYIKWLQINSITKWHIKKTCDFKGVCLYETAKVAVSARDLYLWKKTEKYCRQDICLVVHCPNLGLIRTLSMLYTEQCSKPPFCK